MHNFGEKCHFSYFNHAIEKSIYVFCYVSLLYLSLKLYSFHYMGSYYTFLVSIIPRFFFIVFYYKWNIFPYYIFKPVSVGILGA